MVFCTPDLFHANAVLKLVYICSFLSQSIIEDTTYPLVHRWTRLSELFTRTHLADLLHKTKTQATAPLDSQSRWHLFTPINVCLRSDYVGLYLRPSVAIHTKWLSVLCAIHCALIRNIFIVIPARGDNLASWFFIYTISPFLKQVG